MLDNSEVHPTKCLRLMFMISCNALAIPVSTAPESACIVNVIINTISMILKRPVIKPCIRSQGIYISFKANSSLSASGSKVSWKKNCVDSVDDAVRGQNVCIDNVGIVH